MNDYRVEFVIPCYNEGPNLPRLLNELEKFASKSVGFVIVNNGSEDNSSSLLEGYLQKGSPPHIRVAEVPKNIGYGAGIKEGLRLTAAPIVGWLHADLQVSLKDAIQVAGLLEHVTSGVAKGNRTKESRTILEHIFTSGLRLATRTITGIDVQDANGQPKVFTRDLLEEVLDGPDDFTLDTYILIRSKISAIRLHTLSVSWAPRQSGVSSWNINLSSRLRVIGQYLEFLIGERRNIKRYVNEVPNPDI